MGKEGEFELNLELSIGGRYGERYGGAENPKEEIQIRRFCEENGGGAGNFTPNFRVSRSDFENVCESMELQRRKEIQALRRQEARRKREEKIRKGRGQNWGFSEDRLFLEAQRLQARVLERESRERECLLEERGGKSCSNGVVGDELSLSLSTDSKVADLYPKVQQWLALQNGEKNGNLSVDEECSNGRKTASLEGCSSAVSDYQSMSQKGGCSSDTGSHSSLQQHHYPTISRPEIDPPESHESSSQAETDQLLGGPKRSPLTSNPQSAPDSFLDQANNASSTSENLSRETSSVPRMPCVSATGNGPNARTIMGFLYKYTKTEVSIVCVCHGNSFSPAAFVEHAGGVDVSQPLKHITIVPTAFR